MKPFQITSASLTKNGNLLINHPQDGWVFTNIDGYFCGKPDEGYDRNDDENEIDFLLRVCPIVRVKTPIWYKPLSRKKSGLWQIIASVRVSEDFSNYDASLCNNGGRYGFWVNAYLFVKTETNRRGNKTYKFATVEQCRTTADFNYTDSGSFQSDCHSYIANDTELNFCHTENGYGESVVSLSDFPTFKDVSHKSVLEIFGKSVIKDLSNKGIFMSNIIAGNKRGFNRNSIKTSI